MAKPEQSVAKVIQAAIPKTIPLCTGDLIYLTVRKRALHASALHFCFVLISR